MRKFIASLCVGLLLIVSNADRVNAQQFSGLFVFGDSLSDSGNIFALTGDTNPPSPPYFNGRFSNGPVWVESLAPALGLPYTQATNFAFGGAESGAGTPIDVLNQVTGFVGAGGTVSADALTVIWAGNNDFLRNAATTPPDVLTTSVVTNIGTAIGTLNAFGASSFLIPNLPKFGNSPGGASTGLGEQLNELASFYNTNLHVALIGLEESLGVQIFIMDIEGLFDDVIAAPSVYGIANTTIPCLGATAQPTGACPNSAAADATLFWDAIHPTGAAHSVISQFAVATLAMFEQPRVVATSSYMAPIILDAQRQTTEQRLMTLRSINTGNEAPATVYASYRYANGNRADRANMAGFEYDLNLITIGVDKLVGSGWAVGAAATFGGAELDLVGGGDADIDTLMGSAYASYKSDSGLFVDLSAALSFDDFETSRNTSFAFRPTANGDTGGTSVYGNFEVGYTLGSGGFSFSPFAGLHYMSTDISAYEETGAAMLNLTVLDQRASGLVGSIGLEFGGSVSSSEGFQLIPILRVAYETELDSLDYGASIQTSTGQITGIGRGDLSDNRITANAGLAVVGKRLSLFVSYQGTIDYSDGKDNAVIGRLSYAF
jgi:outer membrane lipase/esterase